MSLLAMFLHKRSDIFVEGRLYRTFIFNEAAARQDGRDQDQSVHEYNESHRRFRHHLSSVSALLRENTFIERLPCAEK
jgi:hypothetical protein